MRSGVGKVGRGIMGVRDGLLVMGVCGADSSSCDPDSRGVATGTS